MIWPRAEFSPIFERPPLRLPGGARVAAWVVVNVEDWAFDAPMARTVLPAPQGVSITPDVPNYSWYEYGLRVGFWRIKRVLDRHGIPAAVSLNGAVCRSSPRLVEACVESGWEIIGHGYVQRAINLEPDERAVIRQTLETIEQATGRRPRGWMGPGLHETYDTLDLLAEEGVEYVCDWVNDDQPYPLQVRQGRLYSMPYTLELNDIPLFIVQHHPSPEMLNRLRYQLETLDAEGAESARVMPVSVHPYITGVPHRIAFFDQMMVHLKQHPGVLCLRPGEILDWYRQETGTAGE